MIPQYEDGDVIVVAGNPRRKGVVDLEDGFYTYIGFAVVWCMKYIFIPFGVGLSVKIVAKKLLQQQPLKQKKKRS